MYSAIRSLPLDGGDTSDYHGSLEGTNLSVDACLVLTSDPKPRLRWTAELHERFIDAVTQLGGPDKATPKAIMKAMEVKGLTLYHLKSHLQKFRLGRQACKESTENSKDASCAGERQDTGSSSTSSLRMAAKEQNEGYQDTEALCAQMEFGRRLHEQLEYGQVQRRLQQRIEAQGKYLQSILEKACKTFNEQASVFTGLEAAREDLSELAMEVSIGSQGTTVPFFDAMMMPSFSELAVAIDNKNNITTNCSVESSLSSVTNGSSISAASMKKRQRGDNMGVAYEAGWIMPSSTTIE